MALVRAESGGKSGHERDRLQEIGMDVGRTSEITDLLNAWGGGNAGALDRLTQLVYQELRHMARRFLKNERSDTIRTTALVNEAYLRLVDIKNVDWQRRAQFFALSAELMRRILVDAARSRGSYKRGGAVVRINLDDGSMVSPEPDQLILALHEALEELAKLAPRQAKVVELRYFGGLSEEEAARVLQTSPRTVRRDWQFAKAWLARDLSGSSLTPGPAG